MERKSLENIDLATILKNSNVLSCEIECIYEENLHYIVDAHYGYQDKCYLKDNAGEPAYKKDCFPTKRGWKEIKTLKKLANNLSGFKKGDWILYKAEIVQIKKINYGLIQEIGNGMFNSSSYNLNDFCFKITIAKKTLSDSFQTMWKEINNMNIQNLRYSAVYMILMEYWREIMIGLENKKDINSLLNEVDFFIKGVTGECNWRLTKYLGYELWHNKK